MDIGQLTASQQKWTVEELESLYGRISDEPRLCGQLMEHLNDSASQQAASWLLKRALVEGQEPSQKDVGAYYRSLSKLKHWETRLNVLQCLPYLYIGKRDASKLESFLRDCLQSENKFVRAWSYNGFNELALQQACYQPEVDSLLAAAQADEAPSVRARIRNILKQRLVNDS
ncbi:hypothetical protein [Gimesia sp.]|uniref:hypothetical protein n=1 Tax=Gimesia sp. TaxID=2024833 RepID=UPI003A8E8ECE